MVKKNFLKSSLIVLAVLAVALIPMASVNAAIDKDDDPSLAYSAHVQNVGWTLASNAGTAESAIATSLAGSEGKSQRLEALKVTFTAPTGVALSCNAHVQGKGWTGWTKLEGKDVLVGTEGECKRLEAIKLSATGLEGFEIKYRAHVQGYGWMDWITADDSTDVTSNFAGTKGECKRIEAIEVLILKTSDAEIFDAHQTAIKTVKEFVANRGTYTFNAKEMDTLLNAWIGSINAKNTVGAINNDVNLAKDALGIILTDEEIYAKADTVRNAIDTWVKGHLNREIQAKSENGTYAEVASIKDAIANAKAELLADSNKEKYKDTDFNTSTGPLYKTALKKIALAVAEYGLETVNELYAKEVTSLSDMVIGASTYNDALKTLKVKDGEINEKDVPATYNVVELVDGLKANKALKTVIEYHRDTAFNAFVNKNYIKNFTSEFGKIKGVLANKDLNYLRDVSYIADAIEAGKANIDAARSTKAVVEAFDSAKAGTVTALRGFINRTIDVLTTMGNDSKALLTAKAAADMRKVMNTDYETVDEEAEALVNAFYTMLHGPNFEQVP